MSNIPNEVVPMLPAQVYLELLDAIRALTAELRAKSDRESQRWVTTKRAAEMLGVESEVTVIRRIKRGGLLGRKTGDSQQSRWEVDVVSIERLIASGFGGLRGSQAA